MKKHLLFAFLGALACTHAVTATICWKMMRSLLKLLKIMSYQPEQLMRRGIRQKLRL